MEHIGIRDLHLKTGEWVRPDDLSTPFSRRRTLPEFDALPVVPGDAARYVSEDRDRG